MDTATSSQSRLRQVAESRRGVIGYSVVIALVGAALAIYFTQAHGLGQRGTWFVVGQAFGIAAAVLLALTGILAVRLAPLQWLFGDMTKVYVAHGIVGLAMFVLITFHPLLYVIGVLPSTNAGGQILIPFNLVVLDWISWILIALALLPTLYVRMRFDLWRFTHLILGAAVVLTMVSLLFTSTTFDTFTIPALRIYLMVLFVASIVAILYVGIFRRLAEPKREYRIEAVDHYPDAGATELHLRATGRPLRFRPGQFTYVDLIDDRLPVHRDYESHPYSIASTAGDDRMSVIVQGIGFRTNRAQRIEADDDTRALVHGAYGQLGFDHDPGRKQLWIGGGVGVTPFLALAQEWARRHEGGTPTPEVTLVVAVDRPERAFYLDRLRRYEAACPDLSVILWSGSDNGRPTAAGLAEHVPDVVDRAVIMSGPEGMLADLSRQFHALGVPRHRLRSEVAIGPPRRWPDAAPALRVMRWAITAELAVFLGGVLASVITRNA